MSSFIKFCFAFILFSFAIVPIYYGINKEHENIVQDTALVNVSEEDKALSFAEIYALAEQSNFSPESLNNIAPAAGEQSNLAEEFSNGFSDFTEPTL